MNAKNPPMLTCSPFRTRHWTLYFRKKSSPQIPFSLNSRRSSSPITGVHFWFDRPVTSEPFFTLLDTNVQWVFNKTALYTDQSDAQVPGAQQYLQLVISASYDLLKKSREEIIDLCLREIRQALPAAREAKLVKATVIKEAAARFP